MSSGYVVVAGAWATIKLSWSDVAVVSRQWWWIPLGVGGWIVVAALGFAASRIGVAAALTSSVGAQLIAGLCIDAATGTRLVASRSLVGVALVLSGMILLATSH